jgi:hypothetical protein
MEEGLSNPVFTADQEIAAFPAACERLSNDGKESWEESDLKAWKESLEESHLKNVISLGRVTSEDVAYVAFPSFHTIESFIVKESDLQTNGNDNYLQKCMEAKEKTRSSRRQSPGKCLTRPTPKLRKSFQQMM